MSEYQYYEFRAIDRSLTQADKEELRRISSRARITSRSFVNHYDFGDFKGDAWEFLERWFDLHLYVANWGTRRLMIRLPASSIPQATLDRLVMSVDEFEYRHAGDHLIISVTQDVEDIDDDSWMLDEDGFLTALAPLRDELMRGDSRMLYLVWLIGFGYDAYEDDATEPQPGIGPLTPALEAFASFFLIDPALVAAAAERPAVLPPTMTAKQRRAILTSLPEEEKTAFLLRALDGDPHLPTDLGMRLLAGTARTEPAPEVPPRTVGELMRAAVRHRGNR